MTRTLSWRTPSAPILAAALAATIALGATTAAAQEEAEEAPATQPSDAEAPAATQSAEQAPAEDAEAATTEPAPEETPEEAPEQVPEFQTTESGLRYQITEPAGEPRTAQPGDVVMVHYTGRLEDGTQFDTSLRPQPFGRRMLVQPFVFPLGEGVVIRGWDEGIEGMKVGEKRTLVIPPDLAYGERGAGNLIPPNATLTFDVELVGLWRTEGQQPPAEDGE